uniref:DUF7378 domain-containing protein n=1 Tax=Setaria italica TaxID=4555 RepID=K4ALS3_SETIT
MRGTIGSKPAQPTILLPSGPSLFLPLLHRDPFSLPIHPVATRDSPQLSAVAPPPPPPDLRWVVVVKSCRCWVAESRGGWASKSFWSGIPWWLPVIMLAGVYQAVVFLATGHITLFLPEAPFAAREALFNVGYKGIGLAVALTSCFSVLFNDQPWVLITWACLQSALIAAILAFWVCLVRAYGKQGATGTKS